MIPVVCKTPWGVPPSFKWPTEMHAVPRKGDQVTSACRCKILQVDFIVWQNVAEDDKYTDWQPHIFLK